MNAEFRWIFWNVQKCAGHGIEPDEVEYVVRHGQPPYPRPIGDDKKLVRGQTDAGRYIQVIFLVDDDDTIFVIHSRPLTEQEKRKYRKERS